MKILHFIFIFIIVLSFACNNSTNTKKETIDASGKRENKDSISFTQKYIHGRLIFEKQCATCHTPPHIYRTDQFIFNHLFDRLPSPSEDYFIRFIENSKALEDSGDRYLLVLKQTYNSKYNHHFKNSITNNEFPSLIYYIKEASGIKR